MTSFSSLKNNFLISMQNLDGSFFGRSVTLICEHNEDGAMGIVINQPTNIHQFELFSHLKLEIKTDIGKKLVYSGGPVAPEQGFVIHRDNRQWQSTLDVSDDIAITTSKDILDNICNQEQPFEHLIALGYAGWDSGQLEQELLDNSWLTVPAKSSIIFDIEPNDRWQAAADLLGIDINNISQDIGHA